MSDNDTARDDVIKFSDHARSHFAATETGRAKAIFRREMQRRFEKLEIDEPDGDDPASLQMAWQTAKRRVREHCDTFGLDPDPLVGKLDSVKPQAGLFGTQNLPAPEAERVRDLRERAVRSAEKCRRQWVHARADEHPSFADGTPAGQKNVMVFAALALEVLDRFSPDRAGDDLPGCPRATIERLADHWLTCEQGNQ